MKKDFKILNYFNMRALFMGIGLSRILNNTQELFPIALLIGTILGVAILKFIKIEHKKSIINAIVATSILCVCYIVLINMISTMYLTKTPKLIVGFPIALLLLYILSKKDIVYLRVGSVLIILNGLLFLISTLSLFKYIDLSNFSYSDTPIKNIFFSGFEYAMYSVVPVYITREKKFNDVSLIGTYLISSLTMGVLFLLTYGILGNSLIGLFRYPEYIILKRVSFFEATANIHNIISFIWIFDIFMLMLSCGHTVKKNIKYPKLIYIIIPILLCIVSYINKFYTAIIFIYRYTLWLLFLSLLLLFLFNTKKA